MERVVVTGLGAVSCIGNTTEEFWNSLIAGRSGIAPITAFDPSGMGFNIAGEVKGFQFDRKLGKRMDRFTQFAYAASSQAFSQAGIEPGGNGGGDKGGGGVNPERVGVCIGTGIGGITFIEVQHGKFLEKGPGRFHPLTVPLIIPNIAAANVGIQFGFMGPNLSISTACATGNHNIGVAMDMIRAGRADVMAAGGTEATISAFSMDGYHVLRALSTRETEPERASCPFSVERDGFVLAEGAGVLVLEAESHAKKRGAEILAEVAGYCMNEDAHHLTAPHPESRGAVQAMRGALEDARINPSEIGYINAHGTSTPLNDAQETAAIRQVCGESAAQIPISSIKSMIGHALGGSAGLEAVACVQVLRHGVIPPTINLERPDPELTLDYVPNDAREVAVDTVLSNSFAFGGQNAVVAFRKYA